MYGEFKLERDGGGGNYITYVKTQQTYKPASGGSVNIYLWLTFINTIQILLPATASFVVEVGNVM